MRRAPRKRDAERPRQYVPRNPYATPAAFPTQPAAVFDGAAVFARLGTDTLFFVFYYQQGTYQQTPRRARAQEAVLALPQEVHDVVPASTRSPRHDGRVEQGTYVYFDYETGWCQRIKSDFTFEYAYLEDELV